MLLVPTSTKDDAESGRRRMRVKCRHKRSNATLGVGRLVQPIKTPSFTPLATPNRREWIHKQAFLRTPRPKTINYHKKHKLSPPTQKPAWRIRSPPHPPGRRLREHRAVHVTSHECRRREGSTGQGRVGSEAHDSPRPGGPTRTRSNFVLGGTGPPHIFVQPAA